MDYTTLDDETLLRLVAHANADALSTLYDRYSRLVFSVAFNAVSDHPTAEEITLDVFTRVWERAGTYRADRATVTTWLASIARHRAIDVLRRRQARPEQFSVEWAEASASNMPHIDGPEEQVALAMQQQRVRAAMAALPEDQKRALALAYFQGLSHNEIAATLREPLGTVKTRIRLGMQKLRQMLQDERFAPADQSSQGSATYNDLGGR